MEESERSERAFDEVREIWLQTVTLTLALAFAFAFASLFFRFDARRI